MNELARVVFIPSTQHEPFEIVINRGLDEEVKVGDRYLVYGIGDEIQDPDTGKSLGRLESVRGKGIVVHVQQHIATLRCIEKRTIYGHSRRTIREKPMGDLLARIIEEEMPPEIQELPFEEPRRGDFAKPI